MESSKTMSKPQNNRWRTKNSNQKSFRICEECAHWWDHHFDAPHECRILKFKQITSNSEAKKPGGIQQHHVEAQEKKVTNSKFENKNRPTRVSTENCTRWRARHSNSSHGCRKLKFKQKHQRRSKNNGWNSTTPCRSPGKMVMNPNFGTKNLPTCVSAEDCTHWWAHHFNFPQGCHELHFTTTTSKTSTSTIAYSKLTHLLVRPYRRAHCETPQFSEVTNLSPVDGYRIFLWGPAMCDLIGELANYLT